MAYGRGCRVMIAMLSSCLAISNACDQSGGSRVAADSLSDADPSTSRRQQEVLLRALLDSLQHLPGEFTNPLPGRWDFSGDRGVFAAFERFGDSAVVQLVGCLNRTQQASATFEETPVLLGFVCYVALRRVAYYEWSQFEDTAGNGRWPGVLDADATANELRTAQRAWREVIMKKRYVLHEPPG